MSLFMFKPKSRDKVDLDSCIHGYTTAEKEFTEQDEPAFVNPFPPMTECWRGYEEAVYDFTQK